MQYASWKEALKNEYPSRAVDSNSSRIYGFRTVEHDEDTVMSEMKLDFSSLATLIAKISDKK